MTKTALAVILHLEHVNATTGADSQWFDASTGGYRGLSPRSVQYVPCIDGASVSPFREQVVDGRTVKEPTPPADVTLTLLRYVNGVDRLAVLVGRNILGRSATVGYVGTAADGTVYTPAAPFIIAQGQVIVPFKVAPDKWTITIRPQNALYQREVPSRALLGYRTGVLGNGDGAKTTVAVVTGYSTMPTALTAMAYVLMARIWGGGNTQCIWGTKAFFFGITTANVWQWRLFVKYSIDAAGTLEEVLGPIISPDEDFHWMSVRFTTTTKAVRFGIDTDYTDATGSAAYVAPAAEDWQMMRFRTDATTVSATVMGAWMLFDAAIDDAVVSRLTKRRARGDETNLVLFFPESDGAGTLYDLATAGGGAPNDATITAGTEVSLFEGPPEMAGQKLPLILQGQHLPLYPVDHARLIYRIARHSIHNVRRVLDGGQDFTIAQRFSVKDLLVNAPGAGEVAMTADAGGLCRFNALQDSAELAADVDGASGWPWALMLGDVYGGASVSFPATLGATLTTAGAWAIELNWEIDSPTIPFTKTVFTSGFLQIAMTLWASGVLFVLFTNTTTGIIETTSSRIEDVTLPYRLVMRFEAWNDGADMGVRVLRYGVVTNQKTVAGKNLANTGGVATLGPLGAQKMAVFPMAAWTLSTPTTRTNEDAIADHRAHLFALPTVIEDGIQAIWYRPTISMAQVDDETGNGFDGTIATPGTYGRWRPGTAWKEPLYAPPYLLKTHGGYDLATQLTIAAFAYGYLEPAAQDLWFPAETTMSKALAMAAGPGFVFLRADETAVLGLVVDAVSGNSQGTIAGVLEVGEKTVAAGEGKGMPPSLVVAEYARIGATGQTALAATDSERRALMSAEVREDAIPIGANATIYGDLPFPDGVRLYSLARFRDAGPTRRELQRLASIWADPRPVYEVRLEGAGRTLQVGDIMAVTDPLGGATAYVLVMARVTGTESETLEVR